MKALRSIAAGLMLSGLSGLTLAAGNPLSVHVLNLENGLPSPDVRVTLEQRQGDGNHSIVARPTPKAASPRSTQKARR